jgi:hypothetical protein
MIFNLDNKQLITFLRDPLIDFLFFFKKGLSIFQSIAFTLQLDNHAFIKQHVQDGRCKEFITEHFSPFFEIFIGL